MGCPACGTDVADDQRFCGGCGLPLRPASQLPTLERPPGAVANAVDQGHAGGSRPTSARGFTPGTLLASRYRIVGLLGRGGMGEVYRADDLKLGTPVALKFLPPALAADPDRTERVVAEVRLARQIAHPNVCRVFDLGETADGERFLTMEFVDGEDLASLLRRIGRLPADKALDIARQLCAALAAAHDRGVVHRDLKPANVMLDGHGRVRIMDFGLAVLADAPGLERDQSGTPAYMAPEQLAGAAASVKSDIYALGLVLYELYTGRIAFTAASLAQLRARKQELPAPPGEVIKDIDPQVDRAILRTLAPDPRLRPATARHVAAALPGGNLLDAALRAGETPSPDMVAASGATDGLEPRLAWALVAIVAVASVAAIALGSRALLWRNAAPARSPDALADAARELIAALGHRETVADRAWGFEVDLAQLQHLEALDPVRWRSKTTAPNVLRFWYRQSPRPLEAWRFPFLYGNVSRITGADPPLDLAGMSLVRFDAGGRLTELVVVPPAAADAAAAPARAPDWAAFLVRAGFDPAAWAPAVPDRNPPVFADTRAAWEGTWPASGGLPVRLEAAALHGTPVYFEAVYPWTPPPRTPAPVLTSMQRGVIVATVFVLGAILIGTAITAQRNLRAGRGDRRGAFRLAAFVFAAMFVSWFVGESHVPTLWEVALVVMALSWALFTASLAWLAYLAVEPFLRRRWPETLVTWTRLLAGEFRDPLVGRDLLVGCAAGTLLAVVAVTTFLVPEWLEVRSPLVFADVYGLVYGVQAVVPFLLWRAAQAVLAALGGVFMLLVLRLACRSQTAAIAVFVIVSAAMSAIGTEDYFVGAISTAIHFGVFAALIIRFGLLAAAAQFYVWGLFIFFPITADLTAWYAGAGVTALLVLAAIALFGFTGALGGRPVLGKVVAD